MRKSLNDPIGKSSVEILNSIKKKRAIVEKLTKLFTNKLQNLMKEKNFPIANLQKEISNFFETYENMKINEYDFVIGRLENHLIDIINNNDNTNNNNKIKNRLEISSSNLNRNIVNNSLNEIYNYSNGLPKENMILNNSNKSNGNNNIINYNNNYNNNYSNGNFDNIILSNENIEKNKTPTQKDFMPMIHHQRSYSTNKELPINFYLNEKLVNLRDKANDEWALIAKFNHLKQLEDDKIKENVKEEKQKKFKEILHSQLIEKDLLKKIKQEEDWQFFIKQNDKLQNLQNEEIKKKKEKQDKVKAVKEIQDKLVYGKLNK